MADEKPQVSDETHINGIIFQHQDGKLTMKHADDPSATVSIEDKDGEQWKSVQAIATLRTSKVLNEEQAREALDKVIGDEYLQTKQGKTIIDGKKSAAEKQSDLMLGTDEKKSEKHKLLEELFPNIQFKELEDLDLGPIVAQRAYGIQRGPYPYMVPLDQFDITNKNGAKRPLPDYEGLPPDIFQSKLPYPYPYKEAGTIVDVLKDGTKNLSVPAASPGISEKSTFPPK